MATLNAFSGKDESTSKLSSSVVDSNCWDSSLIDLKLGRFPDHRDGQNSSFSIGAPILSSSESSTYPKRVQAAGVNSHTAYCQVYGCNKDLTSSKEYHKRHKVCEVHSKTASVIVNGIGQRFCQQCSRFHFLAEFDDGKRSCHKRLTGHNEQRRKPQVGIHSGRAGRLLQQYNDSGYALSLLSSQSQNSSSHSSGIPMARSLVIPGRHNHYNMSQVSEKLIGVSWLASTAGLSNKFSSSGMNSTEGSHLGALLISDGSEAANFNTTDGIYQGSEFMNTKDCLSCEDGPTIDLLQLSSQLQRVEHQRQSMQVKQENEAFSCLRIT
ncbi:hypothetical protein CRYUN_Cryun13aG0026900 [Craigia yunnanensis]